jgi:uncharacterized membrane protein HdeD (DUF308 family)
MGWLELGWKILVARGVVAAVFGVVAMVWPVETVTGLVLLWGFWAMADGAASLVAAVQADGAASRLGYAAIGVVSLLAAFFALFQPLTSAEALTWVLGVWLLVRGLAEAFSAIADTEGGPVAIRLCGALVSVAAGALFAANPGRAALGITVLLGFVALVWGLVLVAAGLAVRRAAGATDDLAL